MRRGSRSHEGTRWLPARRRRAVRCALRGHVWRSQPVVGGHVLVMCERCRELVSAPFVDVPEVLASPAEPGRSLLGTASGGRVVVDLLGAALAGDATGFAWARSLATSRPGEAVDSLACLVLASGLDRARLQELAVRHELGLLDERGGS